MGVAITDDLSGESEPLVDVIQIELGNSRAHNGGGAWEEDGRSRASVVYNDEDGVFPIALREPHDHIHGNLLEW
jgi:hypothetical protein